MPHCWIARYWSAVVFVALARPERHSSICGMSRHRNASRGRHLSRRGRYTRYICRAGLRIRTRTRRDLLVHRDHFRHDRSRAIEEFDARRIFQIA